ncbi:putative reverse transcriptase domain-containing protein [Tanacetum coccineum]|uniref:Reverse transcriptase domain-containing protein n=1 Tax=Tanacetum coccineum TaxID=301880 RepID=A0ABQ5HE04_9ASTR
MVGAGHAAYTDRFHELAKLVPHLVTPENKRIESGETSRYRNVKDDNKRTRIGNAFATTANPMRREYTGMTPKMVNPVNARNLTAVHGACFECGGTNHFKEACPRLNQAQRPGGGHPNQVVAIDGGQGRRKNGNQAHGGVFMLGAEVARQDPNIVTGTFTLNNHYATTLFDSGADYSFISTAFTPLLGIESSNLGFNYEIEIASGQLVEIDKVIRGYELEIEGHTFCIDLILFGSRSFDTLRVVGERLEEKVRYLRSAKAKEQKKEDIVMVRNFPEVFLDDLSGLPPNQEIKFRIDLIPGAITVAKSLYRLAPSEMEELSG